jgi:hypothetical protein
MKSIFSQISNSSLFNHVMRLAMIVVFLSSAFTVTAGETKYYAKCTVKVATGSGTIYVSKSKTNNPPYGSGNSQSGSSSEYLGGMVGGNPIAFYLYSNPSDGYYLKGWTVSSTGADVADGSNVNPYSIELTPTSTTESSPNPNVTYYAVFKQYVYGYSNGRSAEISQGADYGLISLDGNNWNTSVSEVTSGDPTKKKQQGDGAENSYEDYITLTYYAKLRDGLVGVYFDGWYDGNGTRISTDLTYNYRFYPTSTSSASPSSPPKIYARFGKKAVYRNYATAQLVVADADDNYQEVPE